MRTVMMLVVGMWILAGAAGCIYVVPVEVMVVDKESGAGIAGAAVTTRFVGGEQAGKVRGGIVQTDASGMAEVRVLLEPGKDGPKGTTGTEIHVEAAGYRAGRKIVGEKGDVKATTLRTEAHVTGRAAEVMVEMEKKE